MPEIGDDDPIPLAKAAQLFFHGHLTKSSLRTEAAKGNLEIIQIANKDFVTRNGIKRMIEKCRKSEDRPASGSDQTQAHGSSRTEKSVSPQIALKQMLAQRRKNSQNTSTSSTDRTAAVVPLR
ncbi:hypothetical protein [Neorhizobium sp. NCHU2750]|uniref:hypothetical protein n=1 Tax=Neorhizobium sp. NCHU2750 TaxID=1825976 RepID=UPI000EB642F7|nr:hypothetical protein NCHU2750_05850 [Neorhizobium sp. NCHU2750]